MLLVNYFWHNSPAVILIFRRHPYFPSSSLFFVVIPIFRVLPIAVRNISQAWLWEGHEPRTYHINLTSPFHGDFPVTVRDLDYARLQEAHKLLNTVNFLDT